MSTNHHGRLEKLATPSALDVPKRSVVKQAEKIRNRGELENFNTEVEARVATRKIERGADLAVTALQGAERQAIIATLAQQSLASVAIANPDASLVAGQSVVMTRVAFDTVAREIIMAYGQGAKRSIESFML